ncbi:MAG TPA: hypothetical protein VNT26_16345 [Candidatus Sulfotelmatobacter sp.]|nr:hypothetical protein [Candidatus Sulfotelmatobacter sp.]
MARGEIDNRTRGWVRGKLWVHGITEPVLLELKGNAAPDLAGCLLTFENPGQTIALRADASLNLSQRGTIGELTASRKVRVLGRPVKGAYSRKKQGLPVPEHLANCLYLEWFSEANGRVVVESADYKLTISPPAWRLSPQEEQQRQQEAAAGFAGFLHQLDQVLESQKHQPPEDKEWDEFDYEKFMRECDARTDKYAELLDKYLDHPDRDRIIAREMGWGGPDVACDQPAEETGAISGPPEAGGYTTGFPEEEAETEAGFEEVEDAPALEPNPATEGVDWVRSEEGDICHPLSLRALRGSLALWRQCEELGLEETEDADLIALENEYQITSAKLAGALDGLAYGRDWNEGPFIVAYLKRALAHLHAAQSALEKVAAKAVLPAPTLASTRSELFALREEILQLMQEFRGQSSGGTLF